MKGNRGAKRITEEIRKKVLSYDKAVLNRKIGAELGLSTPTVRYLRNPLIEKSVKEKNRNRYLKYKLSIAKRRLQFSDEELEKQKLVKQQYRKLNIDKVKEQGGRYYWNNIINSKLSSAIRYMIRGSFKIGSRYEKLLGYSANEFRSYIQNQFTGDMNWNNYGICWEIDHIVPKSKFCISGWDSADIKTCWSLNNLRPTIIRDNKRKHTKTLEELNYLMQN